ncbi:aminoglycoside phosphotransferase family protein [Ktedonosporobacter rubrisoli]|uniref:Aminoglycoside phosphotransferase family protein n=1 Tax=Ktedonosporobacter rubrisoli TaxID=2509675 RepID=A0A4P6JW39_KTERU|nr:aminoglycoside phosphotransferase family protein [Ktedonosporobacter rubrisoli]QBD79580.1 aminoglycoside phosphotransferase family protein [Ktedonosporobacter rubrisoli]
MGYAVHQPLDMRHVQETIVKVFRRAPAIVERMQAGHSTYVYRIVFPRETFYLRVLPEEGASFAPEVAAHVQLRRKQIKVPEVIYFEHYNELLQRSVLITTEIKGQPLSQSSTLLPKEMEAIAGDAGRDLARMNDVLVDGFGWIRRDTSETKRLRAEHSTYRSFALESWKADLDYLAEHVLSGAEATLLERILARYEAWLDCEQGQLAHGDFDTTHIYQDNGRYTGIIDFGEIRGAEHCYDLGHFHMRDGEQLPWRLLPALVSAYREQTSLPCVDEQHIRFTSLLINVRALARSLRKRPTDRFTRHQLEVLQEDLAALPI